MSLTRSRGCRQTSRNHRRTERKWFTRISNCFHTSWGLWMMNKEKIELIGIVILNSSTAFGLWSIQVVSITNETSEIYTTYEIENLIQRVYKKPAMKTSSLEYSNIFIFSTLQTYFLHAMWRRVVLKPSLSFSVKSSWVRKKHFFLEKLKRASDHRVEFSITSSFLFLIQFILIFLIWENLFCSASVRLLIALLWTLTNRKVMRSAVWEIEHSLFFFPSICQ